jgi:hypothetical protein
MQSLWEGMQTTVMSGLKMTPVIFYRGLGKLANFPLPLVVSTNTLVVPRFGESPSDDPQA